MPSKAFNAVHSPSLLPATDWYPGVAAASLAARQGPDRINQARQWLQLEGSLTRALQSRCRRDFQVDVLQEGVRLPRTEEALTLGLQPREFAWIREVQLCGDGQPWVMARTVIPLSVLSGPGRRLRHLGRQPLGAFLFRRPEWQRGPFQTGLCQADRGAVNACRPLVARRSRFHCGRHALLVGEYFLPDLLARPGPAI